MDINYEIKFLERMLALAGDKTAKNHFEKILVSMKKYKKLISRQPDTKIKNEKWKPIVDSYWHTLYQVSNFGRFKDVRTGKLRKPVLNKATGFLQLMLLDGKKLQLKRTANMIAKAWVPKPDNEMQYTVAYKNNKRLDERASNLKWVTTYGGRYEIRTPGICNEVRTLKKEGLALKEICKRTKLKWGAVVYILYTKKQKRSSIKPHSRPFNFIKGDAAGPYQSR